jgi:hypothetical protein
MIARARFHFVFLVTALVPTAFQAITPDAHNLASLRGMYILWSRPDPPEAGSDEDDSGDSELASLANDGLALTRRSNDVVPRREAPGNEPGPKAARLSVLELSYHHSVKAGAHRLYLALSRLAC